MVFLVDGRPGLTDDAKAIIAQLEAEQVTKLNRTIPEFGPGDTVIVNVKVKEGERTRVQAYEGVCIGRSGGGLNESFTVRKISYGEGVERVFPVYSPMIDSIKVVRRGAVRRAKLYYLRGRTGKRARIAESEPAPGGLQSLTGQNIDLQYGEDGQTLQRRQRTRPGEFHLGEGTLVDYGHPLAHGVMLVAHMLEPVGPGEGRLVLTTQGISHLDGQATQNSSLGVNHAPFPTLHIDFRQKGLHDSALFQKGRRR